MVDPDEIIEIVTDAFDTLQTASEPYEGLIPSVLHRDTGEMYEVIPGRIQAQRVVDRSHYGTNLMYDIPLLHAMEGIATAGGDSTDDYDVTVDQYIDRFVDHCLPTATGIFPWGDHAYWNLVDDRVGTSGEFHSGGYPDEEEGVHDHYRVAPPWLWERLHAADPDCVQRFADGLDYHWISELRQTFDRHAWITKRGRKKWVPTDAGCDFPGDTGQYVVDLSMAYTYQARPVTREQIVRFLDYWWDRRCEIPWWDEQRLLPLESYGNVDPRVAQTRSAAVSFLHAATILDDIAPDLAATARKRGETYLHGALTAETESGGPDDDADGLWGGGGSYGNDPPAAAGLQYVAAWRYRGDERALDRARDIGRAYLDAEPPEDGLLTFEKSGIIVERGNSEFVDPDEPVPLSAGDAGLIIELLADLYEVTDDEQFCDRGLDLTSSFQDVFFDDAPLPRGAAGIKWYESQLGTGTLLHGIARIALLAREGADPIGPNYVNR